MTPASEASAGPTGEQLVEAFRILLDLGNRAGGLVDDVLAEFDVTASAAGVLWAVAGSAPPTMREIASRMRCDPSTISLTADKLEATGIVIRQPHPGDGRKRTLLLTDRGHELWRALSSRLNSSDLLAGLDPDEQLALVALLAKIQPPHTD